jgi:hypothetical protein
MKLSQRAFLTMNALTSTKSSFLELRPQQMLDVKLAGATSSKSQSRYTPLA